MSAFIPNTRIGILQRTETEDSYGDPVASEDIVPGKGGVPAYLYQSNQSVFDPASGRRTVVTGFGIRLRPGVYDFTENDRVVDTATGRMFSVDSVTESGSIGTAGDIQLTAKRIR